MNEPRTSGSICVGIDGSDAALRAVEWATTEAAARDLPLELVYVIATDFDYVPVPDDTGIEPRYAKEVLHAARVAAVAKDDSVKIETEVITGRLSATMNYLSKSAELMVVGSVGIGFLGEMFLGSTAAGLAHNSECPVAIVRAPRHGSLPTGGPVVVAVDNSAGNDAVVGLAMREANIRKTDVLAVHGWRLALGALPDASHLAAGQRRAQELLDRRLRRWQGQFPDVRANAVVVRGSTTSYLEQLSETAQLVVVGGNEHSHLPGAALGSISNAMIHRAKCPVVVVPDLATE